MPIKIKLSGISLFLLLLTAVSEARMADTIWFKGKVEEAFAKAKKEQKPLFLYWGAVWCPPCNEIKSEVFSKPRFVELMKPFVAVYLDGDSDRAQIWGDKLGATGYPTILVYDAKGREAMRIDSGVNLEEFELALAPLASHARPLVDTLKMAGAGQLSEEDWRLLAYLSFTQVKEPALTSEEKIDLFKKLVAQVPVHLDIEKALLSGKYISALLDGAGKPGLAEDQRALVTSLLTYILASEARLKASRGFVLSQASTVLGAIDKERKSPRYQKLRMMILVAADKLASTPELSADTKLWAKAVEWDLFHAEHEDSRPEKTLENKIIAAVKAADIEAKSPYQRHSVISGAAYLLQQIGRTDEARKMLEKEAAGSDTPWYYQSSLSDLEAGVGRLDLASKWSQRAKQSAKGRATRLQWIVNDLLFNLKVAQKKQDHAYLSNVREFYDVALDLRDGFVGRNGLRAVRVAMSLKPLMANASLMAVVRPYREKCLKIKGINGEKCAAHFASLGI